MSTEKSPEAFRTISEVSDLLNTPAHVLRFWESRFSQIKPVKRGGGRRYYRPADVALIGGVKKLLHEDGLTIRGVQKILKEQGVRHVSGLLPETLSTPTATSPAPAPRISERSSVALPSEAKPGQTQQAGRDLPAEVLPDSAAMRRPDTSPGADSRAALGRSQAVPEAPMQVDAPSMTSDTTDNVLPLGEAKPPAHGPESRPAATAAESPPAATMLRAMDILRAREKKTELTSVYLRLVDLKQRMSTSGPAPRR